jgi:rod shape-determining protein MreD
VASLIIQGHSSFDVLRVAGVKPDLLFIAVVYFGYTFGSFYGEVTGFIGGLLHDSVSNSPLGLLTFPKMAVGFLAGMFGRSVFRENAVTVFLLLLSASLIKGIITLFLCYLFHEASVSAIASIIIPESIYNAVVAPPLFMLYDKIFEREIQREGS